MEEPALRAARQVEQQLPARRSDGGPDPYAQLAGWRRRHSADGGGAGEPLLGSGGGLYGIGLHEGRKRFEVFYGGRSRKYGTKPTKAYFLRLKQLPV
jgi:hypothetical protein